MPDLTETQLARIRDGATLVATAIQIDNDTDVVEPANVEIGQFAVIDPDRNDLRELVYAPRPGTPIHPSLPGLTWGRSRAVRLSDLTTDIALQLCFDGGLKPCLEEFGGAKFDKSNSAEVYDKWLWLTEVKRP